MFHGGMALKVSEKFQAFKSSDILRTKNLKSHNINP